MSKLGGDKGGGLCNVDHPQDWTTEISRQQDMICICDVYRGKTIRVFLSGDYDATYTVSRH